MSGKKKNIRKRVPRASSNVFAMFDQAQIQLFKEAFYMLDTDKDGFITNLDLQDIFASLGKNQSDESIEKMLNEASGPINFTMFLTLFGSKMCGTDSEDVLKNAFSCFDEKGTGLIPEEYFREMLSTTGDRYTAEEVEELMADVPTKNGMINYFELSHMLKNGKTKQEIKKTNVSK